MFSIHLRPKRIYLKKRWKYKHQHVKPILLSCFAFTAAETHVRNRQGLPTEFDWPLYVSINNSVIVIGSRDVFGNATSVYFFSTLTAGRNLRVRFLSCLDSYVLVIHFIYTHLVSVTILKQYYANLYTRRCMLFFLLLRDIYGCALKNYVQHL